MTVDDWIKVSDYPHQSREFTERRALDSHWKRAKSAASATQLYLSMVTAAICGADVYKIDGHARAELWRRGYLRSPGRVTVVLYEISGDRELTEFYNAVQRGARQFYEQVRTIYEQLGISIRSPRLSRGFIIDALNIVTRGAPRGKQDKRSYREEIDLRETVRHFRPEIEMIDSINPPFDIFYSGVLAAAFLTLALNPQRLTFFAKLAAKQGTKLQGRMDPIESVLNLLDSARLKKTQAQTQIDLCARTIRAINTWDLGENNPRYWMKNIVTPVDLPSVVREVKRLKGM